MSSYKLVLCEDNQIPIIKLAFNLESQIWLCKLKSRERYTTLKDDNVRYDGHLSSVVEVPKLRLPAHQGVGIAH